jgi:hypothetical protein
MMALAMASNAFSAPDSDPLTDRVSFSVGGFLLNTSTAVRVDGRGRSGSEIDLERDLGFNETDRVRVDAYWRFAPRHKIRALYFNTRRAQSRTIQRDIEFRDRTFTLSSEVHASLETEVAELAYEYAFLRRQRYELAGTAGVHNVTFDLRLSALTASRTVDFAESASIDGPLPVIGLRGIWRLTNKMYFDAQAQFFKIGLDEYDGRIEDYTASIVWQAFRHVGIGAGYNEFITRADVDGERFGGHVRWRYGGARIFLVASF